MYSVSLQRDKIDKFCEYFHTEMFGYFTKCYIDAHMAGIYLVQQPDVL